MTGGEPLLQPDVYPLMQRLLDSGKTVLIETGGHRSIAEVPAGVIRIMDVKCPGSGESAKNDWTNLAHLHAKRRGEVRDRRSRATTSSRATSCSASDLADARQRGAVLAGARRARSEAAVGMGARRSLPVRVQLQVHKYIWSPDDAWRLDRDRYRNAGAVVLLSGGLDSYTAAAVARRDGFSISRAQHQLRPAARPRARRGAAPWRGRSASTRHLELELDLTKIGGSALTRRRSTCRRISRSIPAVIPSTYVPARNTIFLSLALGWAEVLGAADIFIGVNALDYSGYPDCRPEFIRAFEQLARLATRAGVEGRPLTVHTPLIALSKADIIRLGAVARPRLRPDAQLLRPASRRPAVRPTATAAGCARRDLQKPVQLTR